MNENIDKKHCNVIEKIDYDTKLRYNAIMASSKYRYAFINYSYFNREDNNKNCNYYNNPHIIFELSRECYNGNNVDYKSMSQLNMPSVESVTTQLRLRKIHQIQRKSNLNVHLKGMKAVYEKENSYAKMLVMNEEISASQKNIFAKKSHSSMLLNKHNIYKNYSSLLNESHH